MSACEAPVTAAGRELDALVAVKVFGWSEERKADYPPNSERAAANCWHRPLIAAPCSLPHFSTDISAAWLVVEKLLADGKQVEVNGYNDEGDPDVDPWVVLINLTVSHAKTAPHAICLAALKAV